MREVLTRFLLADGCQTCISASLQRLATGVQLLSSAFVASSGQARPEALKLWQENPEKHLRVRWLAAIFSISAISWSVEVMTPGGLSWQTQTMSECL